MAPLFTGYRFGFAAGPTGPISITGGTTYTPGNGYKYHVFTYPNSSNFEVSNGTLTAEVLIVAGGGGAGGGYYTGGAGGGGVVYGPSVVITAGTYTIKVGLGGTGGAGAGVVSGDGQPSAFGAVTALGGGGGGSGPQAGGTNNVPGKSGGSAGGNSVYQVIGGNAASPQPVPGSYFAYGNSSATTPTGEGGAGGGGAGIAGGIPVPKRRGGDGLAFPGFAGPLIPVLSPVVPSMGPTGDYYGGGGSGGHPGADFIGGAGGGGYGTSGGTDPATPGVTATGATHLGGGGGGRGNPAGAGGDGGPGIVIIRYLI